nr:MAG TPA: hypothetical protein [Bacteriophage sp.]
MNVGFMYFILILNFLIFQHLLQNICGLFLQPYNL